LTNFADTVSPPISTGALTPAVSTPPVGSCVPITASVRALAP
jgi:hypothetical protein